MNKRNLETKINHAFSHLPPDELPEYILSACTEQKGVIPMKESKKTNLILRRTFAIAAAFLLVIAGGFGLWQFQLGRAVASTVSLDVNPSIEIKVNKNEKVLAVEPRNEDAKTIIGTMDFKGSNLDVTVNALIGSMLQKGYITELANSILISVNNKDAAEAARLQQKLAAEIEGLLHTDTFDGAVLSQTVTQSEALTQQAETSNISTGKAQLIQKVIELNPLRTFEELAALSINELNLLLNSAQNTESTGTASAPNDVTSTGTASQKAYIGGDKAKEIAFKHAGTSADQVRDLELELDYEKGTMCYEVDFKAAGYEYEYDINAKTGEVVKNEKDRDDDYVETPVTKPATDTNTSSGSTAQSGTANTKPSTGTTQSGTTSGNTGSSYITKDAAKSTALSHAGVSADAIRGYEIEFDEDDGRFLYEIEFRFSDVEYKYDIDAKTGTILKSEKEIDD